MGSGLNEFLQSRGFLPGGEGVINGEVFTADELTAAIDPDVDWGICIAPTE